MQRSSVRRCPASAAPRPLEKASSLDSGTKWSGPARHKSDLSPEAARTFAAHRQCEPVCRPSRPRALLCAPRAYLRLPAPHFGSSLPAAPLSRFPPTTHLNSASKAPLLMSKCISFTSSRETPRPHSGREVRGDPEDYQPEQKWQQFLRLGCLPKTGLRTCTPVTSTEPQRPLALTFASLYLTSLPATDQRLRNGLILPNSKHLLKVRDTTVGRRHSPPCF